ncbi:MAG: TonB-dependent receptor [Rhizorhabdus sp.]
MHNLVYKGSGLNLNSAVSAGTLLVLAPEKVRDWEIGSRQQAFDRRLTLNFSAYWTNFIGLQANIVPTNVNRSYLVNVGSVRSRGIEVDGAWRFRETFSLTANGSHNDAVYTDYRNAPCPVGVSGVCDLIGRPLCQVPRWVGNAIIDYHAKGSRPVLPYVIRQASYRSSTYGTADAGPYSRIDAFGLANIRQGATLRNGRSDLSAWVNNVFDKYYFQNLLTTAIGGAAPFAYAGQLGTARTAGAMLRALF